MLYKKRAFTLIEILAVIAIIAIITAVLFPSFSRARADARKATCLSNMRQIGMAMGSYMQDNDSTFPPALSGQTVGGSRDQSEASSKNAPTWFDLIAAPYSGFACPEVVVPSYLAKATGDNSVSGYAFNSYLIGEQVSPDRKGYTVNGKNEMIVHDASTTVVVFEARAGIIASSVTDDPLVKVVVGPSDPPDVADDDFDVDKDKAYGGRRHGGTLSNYVFADWHVKTYNSSSINAGPVSIPGVPGFAP